MAPRGYQVGNGSACTVSGSPRTASTGAYVGFVWLVGRGGPVFEAQVDYLVIWFGVIWSMLLLGETIRYGYGVH